MTSPTKHAMLAPSSAHRWLECTPSAMLESTKPSIPSVYAEEGTEAHALAEIKLKYALGKIDDDEYTHLFENFRLTSRFYNEEFNEFVNNYINEVMTIVTSDYAGQQVKVELEERVSFDDIVPDGAGTSDVVIVGRNFIHIVDLKFGKGIPVSAIGNPQLKLYALGAIRKHIGECICQIVRMTIVQPRLYEESTDAMMVVDLNKWAIDYVRPRALLAREGKGELVPGDHCKFCKCRGECKVLAERQLAVAQAEFDNTLDGHVLEPCDMTPDMIARILFIAPKFIDWFKDVEKYATASAINSDIKIPGYKIVEGRSVRIMTDQCAVAEKLRELGYSDEELYEPRKLKSLTSLEKAIGKKRFTEICGEYICKPQGKPTLVHESDKRQAMDIRTLQLNGSEFLDDYQTDNEEN